MVLNPDVTVRSRGVMEKCTLCVQRIQAGKNQATPRGAPLADGDIRDRVPAEPARREAIVFGDLKDPAQPRLDAARRAGAPTSVLEELGTRPAVGYLKKIRVAGGHVSAA